MEGVVKDMVRLVEDEELVVIVDDLKRSARLLLGGVIGRGLVKANELGGGGRGRLSSRLER